MLANQYQSLVRDLATAQVLRLMAVQDNGVQFASIGDTSTNNKNFVDMANTFEKQAMDQLKALTKGITFYKTRG